MAPRLCMPFLIAAAMSGCTIHHAILHVPDTDDAPGASDGVAGSASCTEAGTVAEHAMCATPRLDALHREMVQVLQADARRASLFGRDAVFASQRAWLLALPDQCRLTDPSATVSPAATACLQTALASRITSLRDWPASPAWQHGAVAAYVSLRQAAGAPAQPDPAFCANFAQRANDSLRQTGTIDPEAMGYEEVAGTHGPAASPPVSVSLYDANAFALFQHRAKSISIGGAAPAITPVSLTLLVDAQNTANQGGRFSSFASQTGDYGAIDVFHSGPRLLALAADPWGSTTPAAAGEAAHAGIWDIGGGYARALCLFDTYTRPADPGAFGALPSLTALRDLLGQIRDSASLPLGAATLRDQGQITSDADFTVLHMPLVAREQARAAGETLWLRHRHDDVLDALFAWSTRTPANKALFDRLFALLRPAASELVHAYQTTQGLNAAEATDAGGIAIMELLYQATITIAPGLGAAPDTPSGTRPRYPVLAAPQ